MLIALLTTSVVYAQPGPPPGPPPGGEKRKEKVEALKRSYYSEKLEGCPGQPRTLGRCSRRTYTCWNATRRRGTWSRAHRRELKRAGGGQAAEPKAAKLKLHPSALDSRKLLELRNRRR